MRGERSRRLALPQCGILLIEQSTPRHEISKPVFGLGAVRCAPHQSLKPGLLASKKSKRATATCGLRIALRQSKPQKNESPAGSDRGSCCKSRRRVHSGDPRCVRPIQDKAHYDALRDVVLSRFPRQGGEIPDHFPAAGRTAAAFHSERLFFHCRRVVVSNFLPFPNFAQCDQMKVVSNPRIRVARVIHIDAGRPGINVVVVPDLNSHAFTPAAPLRLRKIDQRAFNGQDPLSRRDLSVREQSQAHLADIEIELFGWVKGLQSRQVARRRNGYWVEGRLRNHRRFCSASTVGQPGIEHGFRLVVIFHSGPAALRAVYAPSNGNATSGNQLATCFLTEICAFNRAFERVLSSYLTPSLVQFLHRWSLCWCRFSFPQGFRAEFRIHGSCKCPFGIGICKEPNSIGMSPVTIEQHFYGKHELANHRVYCLHPCLCYGLAQPLIPVRESREECRQS